MILAKYKTKLSFMIGLVAATLILSISLGGSALAQAEQLCIGSGGSYENGVCTPKPGTPTIVGTEEASGLIERVINILLYIIGAVSVLMVVIGALRYVISAGDQQAVTNAKNTILYAVVGLILAFVSWGIINFVIGFLSEA